MKYGFCNVGVNNDQNQSDTAGSGGKNESDAGRDKPNASRRNFLKLGLAGAGAAAAAAGGITVIRRMEGIPHDDFPLPIREDYKWQNSIENRFYM